MDDLVMAWYKALKSVSRSGCALFRSCSACVVFQLWKSDLNRRITCIRRGVDVTMTFLVGLCCWGVSPNALAMI